MNLLAFKLFSNEMLTKKAFKLIQNLYIKNSLLGLCLYLIGVAKNYPLRSQFSGVRHSLLILKILMALEEDQPAHKKDGLKHQESD